jgi:hypothetical protein
MIVLLIIELILCVALFICLYKVFKLNDTIISLLKENLKQDVNINNSNKTI